MKIVKCDSYDYEKVKKQVRLLMKGFKVDKGEKVLLKPNLLMPMPPEKMVTTHPSIVKAVAEIVKEKKGIPIVCDTNGGPTSKALMKVLYERTGMKKVSEETGVKLWYDTRSKYYGYPEGVFTKGFELMTIIEEVDKVINLPKIKTHSFMKMTCCVKNLFGLIPGMKKPGYHTKMKDADSFGKMLVDLAGFVKTDLTIVDGIIGMEGNGPSGGEPRKIGLLIGGKNNFWIDQVVCRIIGMPVSMVPYMHEAGKRGLLKKSINVNNSLVVKGFKKPDTSQMNSMIDNLPVFLRNFFINLFVTHPIITDRCVGCGTCVKTCPEQVITLVDKKAVIDHKRCIRCYCCHEVCPYKAINLKKGIIL